MNLDLFNKFVFEKTNGIVQNGIFKGLKYKKNYGNAHNKILGIYENQLYMYIQDAVSKKPNLFINLGCGDGYYGLGVAKMLQNIKCILVDTNEIELNRCQENCEINELKNIEFKKKLSFEEIKEFSEQYKNIFCIIDIEGGEEEILNFNYNFENCTFLIECHDFIKFDITDKLKNKFMFSHKIYEINDCEKSIHFNDLDLSLDEKIFFQSEGRPCNMKWLYLKKL